MSTINFKNLQLKQKQQLRYSKQNITITNLNSNKLAQPKQIFRFIPTIKPSTTISTSSNIVMVEPSSNAVIEPIIVTPVEPIIVTPVEPIIVTPVEPIIVTPVEPIIVTPNSSFTLQYIKSKIMSDYGNLYKSA